MYECRAPLLAEKFKYYTIDMKIPTFEKTSWFRSHAAKKFELYILLYPHHRFKTVHALSPKLPERDDDWVKNATYFWSSFITLTYA